MYTDRILRPYGSLSTRARTGILSVVFSFFRKSLKVRQMAGRCQTGGPQAGRQAGRWTKMEWRGHG